MIHRILAALTLLTLALGAPVRAGGECEWAPITPGAPSAASGFGFAYDASSERIVMVAGRNLSGPLVQETWLYDGDWTLQAVSNPPALDSPALVYDSAREECVLFGGFGPVVGFSDQTWIWDGVAWSERVTPGPPGRSSFGMAFDAARAEVVIFGGAGGGMDLNDTWVWNGATWTIRNPPIRPSSRGSLAMAYHAGIEQVVLFGGFASPVPDDTVGDTWLWNGTSWTELAIPGPPPRSNHQMTYDPDRDVILLWGGYNSTFQSLSDTWQFDGVQWTELSVPGSAPYTANYGLAYDHSRRRFVLRGSEGNTAIRMYELGQDEINITSSPLDMVRPAGQAATLTIGVENPAAFSFQWYRNNMPLADGAGLSGAQTPSLTIQSAAPNDTGWYRVVVIGSCGAVTRSAVLAVLCPGDADGDGSVNFADLNLTISNFNTACPTP